MDVHLRVSMYYSRFKHCPVRKNIVYFLKGFGTHFTPNLLLIRHGEDLGLVVAGRKVAAHVQAHTKHGGLD